LAWLTALSLAATASFVALSARAGTFELEPYTPSDELEKALALLPRIEHGKSLYRAHCAECHGAESWGSASDGRTPALAGQHYQYLVKQIADLRRADPALDRGAFHLATLKQLRDEQAIADVSAYLSGLTPNPRPRVGPGDRIVLGGDTYDWLCRGCHEISGEGDAIFFTPRISAQHYEYPCNNPRTSPPVIGSTCHRSYWATPWRCPASSARRWRTTCRAWRYPRRPRKPQSQSRRRQKKETPEASGFKDGRAARPPPSRRS
jgi:cytochrome c553